MCCCEKLILGTLLLLGCSGSPTKPGTGPGDPVLKLTRQPALGFCLQEGEIFKATVWRNSAGVRTMTGSTLVGFDGLRDSCVVPIPPGRCLVEVQFAQHVLTSEEVTALTRLLAAVPVETHQINYACDPCLITRYEFNGRVEDDNPCATATEEYRRSLAEVEQFLESLTQNAAQ